MMHKHRHSVTLLCCLNWLSEHFHWFYLTLLLYLAQLYLFSRFNTSFNYGSSYNCSFTLYLETMIYEVKKFILTMSIRQTYYI
jgi:hypothetical protein